MRALSNVIQHPVFVLQPGALGTFARPRRSEDQHLKSQQISAALLPCFDHLGRRRCCFTGSVGSEASHDARNSDNGDAPAHKPLHLHHRLFSYKPGGWVLTVTVSAKMRAMKRPLCRLSARTYSTGTQSPVQTVSGVKVVDAEAWWQTVHPLPTKGKPRGLLESGGVGFWDDEHNFVRTPVVALSAVGGIPIRSESPSDISTTLLFMLYQGWLQRRKSGVEHRFWRRGESINIICAQRD